ncbi:MAG: hypothetical protein ABIF85_05570 [Nanoarchaeota archaeon]|nr:hypothetical protein [Nanoarchaeota archaeon]MCG2724611.1 hypothetical protein [archaeon]
MGGLNTDVSAEKYRFVDIILLSTLTLLITTILLKVKRTQKVGATISIIEGLSILYYSTLGLSLLTFGAQNVSFSDNSLLFITPAIYGLAILLLFAGIHYFWKKQ